MLLYSKKQLQMENIFDVSIFKSRVKCCGNFSNISMSKVQNADNRNEVRNKHILLPVSSISANDIKLHLIVSSTDPCFN